MTQQVIITNPINSGLGDTLKVAFDKCNNNFNDLYGAAPSLVNSISLNDTSTSPIYVTSPAGPAAGVVAETITLKTQTANLVFAGPSAGGPAQPTFRALVAADLGGAIVSSVSLNDTSAAPIFTTSPTAATSGAVAETLALLAQSAALVFAGPISGAAAQPSFRALAMSDLPTSTISDSLMAWMAA
jgi:hypothetical protein